MYGVRMYEVMSMHLSVHSSIISCLVAYSDFLDEHQVKPGPKYLPLGRPFQEHVAIFK
jgi:hypothetical protein